MLKKLSTIFIILLGAAGLVMAQFGLEQKVVDVKVLASQEKIVAGQEFDLAIVIDVAEGLHINSNEPKEEFQIPTLVVFEPMSNLSFGNPLFPPADMKSFAFSEQPIPVYEGEVIAFVTVSTSPQLKPGPKTIKGKVTFQGCNESVCFPPGEAPFEITLQAVAAGSPVQKTHQDIFAKMASYEKDEGAKQREFTADELRAREILDKGLVYAIFAFFVVGLALNLTPCVYPVIPLTVSYFGGQSAKSKGSSFISALFYLLGIAITFAVLGLVSGLAGKQWGFLFQSPWFVLVIVMIILSMAASMFGAFEITVPSFLMNKFGGAREGIVGALIMGLTVGVVIAPCAAGIIIGLVGLIAKLGLVVKGTLLFFVMGLGLGLPYLILATFSGLLNKLPQSGMWMVWVRKLFGILLVGVAIYFLMPQLERIYDKLGFMLGLLSIFGGLLLGFLDHAPGYTRGFKIGRAVFGIVIVLLGINWTQAAINSRPSEIDWIKYEGQSMEQLLAEGKPIFIDFYADWCAPCKKLDRVTFTDSRVVELAKSFTMIKVDCTKPDHTVQSFKDRFHATGMPTLVFINPKGEEIESLRKVGYIGPDKFLESMKAALEP